MIVAVVGPSGAGKDTLIAGARALRPDLHLLRRVITRPEAAGGEDFEGVDGAEFARRKARGDFVLDWEAHGLSYGLPRHRIVPQGVTIFNGSRHALAPALQVFPGLRVVLVTAPVPVLAERLAARGREAAADIAARLDRAGFDLPPAISARVVINDGPPQEGIERFLAALQP